MRRPPALRRDRSLQPLGEGGRLRPSVRRPGSGAAVAGRRRSRPRRVRRRRGGTRQERRLQRLRAAAAADVLAGAGHDRGGPGRDLAEVTWTSASESLPLTAPPDWWPKMHADVSKAVDAGFTWRPLAQTVRDIADYAASSSEEPEHFANPAAPPIDNCQPPVTPGMACPDDLRPTRMRSRSSTCRSSRRRLPWRRLAQTVRGIADHAGIKSSVLAEAIASHESSAGCQPCGAPLAVG